MGENEKSPIFIGARALTRDEVKLIVPTYDELISRIKDIRDEAVKYRQSNNKHEEKKYNNTIALFGKRGSGKTSTMYTLIKGLKGGSIDVVLDTIEPDNIGSEGKIMGCILGLLKKEIDSIQSKVKQQNLNQRTDYIQDTFFKDCKFIESNKLVIKYKELLEYYVYTERDYKTVLTSSFTDLNSYIKKSSHILNADIEFANQFRGFVDELVKVKQEMTNKEENYNSKDVKEPLIFIFIDDIDLNTSKCQEIIEAILKYAAHPNIVCFISGDYETFEEEFLISLLKKEGLPEANLSPKSAIFNTPNINVLKSKQVLTYEYMKKVFPPSYRHYVNTWNLSLRPLYSFGKDDKNLYELLVELLMIKGGENIFGYQESTGKPVYFLPAYHIFDETSRGLINVYYALNKALLNLKSIMENDGINQGKKNEAYFVMVKAFIDNLIDSSKIFATKRVTKEKVFLWGSTEESSKVDLEYILNLIKIEYKDFKVDHKVEIEELVSYWALLYLSYLVIVLLPDISYSKNIQQLCLKYLMGLLLFFPKLSNKEIEVANKDSELSNFLAIHPIILFKHERNFKVFIKNLMINLKLGFALRFYKNLFDEYFQVGDKHYENKIASKLGYRIFDEDFKDSDTAYKLIYIAFYRTLSRHKTSDVPLLKEMYKKHTLISFMYFLNIDTTETNEISYTKQIFEEIFWNIENSLSLNKVNPLRYDYMNIVAKEVKKVCSEEISSVIASAESMQIHIKVLVEKYKGLEKDSVNGDIKKLLNLLYKLYVKQIKSDEKDSIDRLYKEENLVRDVNNKMKKIMVEKLVNLFKDRNNEGKRCMVIIDTNEFKKFTSKTYGISSYVTKAEECKQEIQKLVDCQNSNILKLNLDTYSTIKNKLDGLVWGKGLYGKEEASKLISYLETDAHIEVNNQSIFNDVEEWLIQAYSLFKQNSQEEIINFTELEEAKKYLADILEEARNENHEDEMKYLKILEIENYEEYLK